MKSSNLGAAPSDEPSPRWGPVRLAIYLGDCPGLLDNIQSRCDVDPDAVDPCWVWRGAVSAEGYAFLGRSVTYRYAHRVVVWAVKGFPGELRDIEAVHHLCSVRRCVKPTHLAEAPVFLNVLESSVRKAFLNRVEALTAVVRSLEPDHPVLYDNWGAGDRKDPPTRGTTFQSPRARIKADERRNAWNARTQQRQRFRFTQVIQVDSFMKLGMSKRLALEAAKMGRSTYSDWSPRLRDWLAQEKRDLGIT